MKAELFLAATLIVATAQLASCTPDEHADLDQLIRTNPVDRIYEDATIDFLKKTGILPSTNDINAQRRLATHHHHHVKYVDERDRYPEPDYKYNNNNNGRHNPQQNQHHQQQQGGGHNGNRNHGGNSNRNHNNANVNNDGNDGNYDNYGRSYNSNNSDNRDNNDKTYVEVGTYSLNGEQSDYWDDDDTVPGDDTVVEIITDDTVDDDSDNRADGSSGNDQPGQMDGAESAVPTPSPSNADTLTPTETGSDEESDEDDGEDGDEDGDEDDEDDDDTLLSRLVFSGFFHKTMSATTVLNAPGNLEQCVDGSGPRTAPPNITLTPTETFPPFPSMVPTQTPSPTIIPVVGVTPSPTALSETPSTAPSAAPSAVPTEATGADATNVPSAATTMAPSVVPSAAPSAVPSESGASATSGASSSSGALTIEETVDMGKRRLSGENSEPGTTFVFLDAPLENIQMLMFGPLMGLVQGACKRTDCFGKAYCEVVVELLDEDGFVALSFTAEGPVENGKNALSITGGQSVLFGVTGQILVTPGDYGGDSGNPEVETTEDTSIDFLEGTDGYMMDFELLLDPRYQILFFGDDDDDEASTER